MLDLNGCEEKILMNLKRQPRNQNLSLYPFMQGIFSIFC